MTYESLERRVERLEGMVRMDFFLFHAAAVLIVVLMGLCVGVLSYRINSIASRLPAAEAQESDQ